MGHTRSLFSTTSLQDRSFIPDHLFHPEGDLFEVCKDNHRQVNTRQEHVNRRVFATPPLDDNIRGFDDEGSASGAVNSGTG